MLFCYTHEYTSIQKSGEGNVDENELLTIPQAAQKLQVNEMTVRRWIKQGKLECVRLGVKLIRTEPQALDDFLRGRMAKTAEKPVEKPVEKPAGTPVGEPEQKSEEQPPKESPIKRLSGDTLSTSEVAQLAGLKTDTVSKMASKGQLPARKRGKFWLFEKAAIDEWLAKRDGWAPEDGQS